MAPSIVASGGGIMICIRCRAEFSTTGVVARCLRPWGRPGVALLAASWEGERRVWALARAAACAASVRRLCSTRIGYERRALTRSTDQVNKDSPGPGLPSKDANKRSNPSVCLPALVTTHASPAKT